MTEWALIIMLCTRSCIAQYVVILPSKAACEARIIKTTLGFSKDSSSCVPIIKEQP